MDKYSKEFLDKYHEYDYGNGKFKYNINDLKKEYNITDKKIPYDLIKYDYNSNCCKCGEKVKVMLKTRSALLDEMRHGIKTIICDECIEEANRLRECKIEECRERLFVEINEFRITPKATFKELSKDMQYDIVVCFIMTKGARGIDKDNLKGLQKYMIDKYIKKGILYVRKENINVYNHADGNMYYNEPIYEYDIDDISIDTIEEWISNNAGFFLRRQMK